MCNKRGTVTLERHLLEPLPALGRTAVNQPLIAAALQTLSTKVNEAHLKGALVYCMNPAVPFRLAGNPGVRQAKQSPEDPSSCCRDRR